VVNGWNNVADNNTGKTLIGSITLKPTKEFTFIENYVVGPELPGTNKGFRNLSDTVATYTVSEKAAIGANFDFLSQGASAPIVPASQQGWGLAGYLHVTPNSWFALTPRFEYVDDSDTLMTGTAQKVKEGTVTLEFKHKDGVMSRIEYRHDFSDVPFFAKSGSATLKKNQDTVTVGLVYSFDSKAP
jgi:hypothetical protein